MSEPKEPEAGAVEVLDQPTKNRRRRRFRASRKGECFSRRRPARQQHLAGVTQVPHLHQPAASLEAAMDEGTLSSLGANEAVVPESALKAAEARIRELERLLGKKTLEAEILQDAVEIAREKNGSRSSLPPREAIHSRPRPSLRSWAADRRAARRPAARGGEPLRPGPSAPEYF